MLGSGLASCHRESALTAREASHGKRAGKWQDLTPATELRKLGARGDEAKLIAGQHRLWWHTSGLGVNRLLPNAHFDRLGVPKFS